MTECSVIINVVLPLTIMPLYYQPCFLRLKVYICFEFLVYILCVCSECFQLRTLAQTEKPFCDHRFEHTRFSCLCPHLYPVKEQPLVPKSPVRSDKILASE